MALNQERLKNRITSVMDKCQQETENPNESKMKFADELAQVIIEEIQQMQLVYNGGLLAPSGGGPVGGILNCSVL